MRELPMSNSSQTGAGAQSWASCPAYVVLPMEDESPGLPTQIRTRITQRLTRCSYYLER